MTKKFKTYKLITFDNHDFSEDPEITCVKPKSAEEDFKTIRLLITLLEGALSHRFLKAGVEI